MSRSRKKNPIFGHCDESEKDDKREANRKFRKKCKILLNKYEDEAILPTMDEIANLWDMAKDGKSYNNTATEKDMRK